MADINVTPQVVNLSYYGGDTINLKVIAAPGVADGLTWVAQIRQTRAASVVDASFAITPPPSPGEPAYLVLSSAISKQLTSNGTIPYQGVWDCQVSQAGNDPVITLMQGSFSLVPDVSRLP